MLMQQKECENGMILRKQKKFNKFKFFEDVNYKPHQGQKEFHKSNARFRIMMCGRRWGKSLSAAMEALQALLSQPNQIGWVVAPTYDLSNKIFREVYWKCLKELPEFVERASMSRQLQEIKLTNGSVLLGKSADNPASLLGEGLNFLIVDESALVKQDTWEQALRPTLTDKGGWALFISTPRGKNWFYKLYARGLDRSQEYASWKFSTLNNPYIDPKEVEQAKSSLPSLIFRQEYQAEPVEAQDQLFYEDLINKCISSELKPLDTPHPKKSYYLGVDFARMGQDSSVFMVAEQQHPDSQNIHIIEIVETKHQLLTDAIGRVIALDKKYQFRRIFLDETGMGSGPSDVLREYLKFKISPINFTIKTKEDMYNNLKILMERGQLKIPKNDKLKYQLLDLRYEYSSNGSMKIHHSDNGQDDYPDSLALSVFFANNARPNFSVAGSVKTI